MNERNSYIGSSDAIDIMRGNWTKVWEEKLGLREREDLSGVFRVQLGNHTERFHIDWIRPQVEAEIGECTLLTNLQVKHKLLPYVRSTLDGVLRRPDEDITMEVKHTNARKTFEDVVDFYMPQLQHHLLVTGGRRLVFSAIMGNDEPQRAWIGPSEEWHERMVSDYALLWHHITEKIAPTDLPVIPKPKTDSVPINNRIAVDAAKSNEFTVHTCDYVETIDAAKRHEAAKKSLKAMMSDDIREMYSPVLTMKRDARGAIRFTVKEAAPVASTGTGG